MLVASLVHHHQWLRSTLPKEHIYFRCNFVISGVCRHLVDLNVVKMGNFNNPETGLKVTGVPPSLLMRKMVADLSTEVSVLRSTITDLHGASMKKLDSQPSAVAQHIVENFRVDGCAPMTTAMLEGQLEGLRHEFRLARQQPIAAAATSAVMPVVIAPTFEGRTAANAGWYDNFAHSGKFNLSVPADFKLTTNFDVQKAWSQWHFGDRDNRIRPFKKFKPSNDITKANRKAYSMMKAVVTALPTPISTEVCSDQHLATFDADFTVLANKAYDGKPPVDAKDIAYITIYERLRKRKSTTEPTDSEDA
jgi:hypothetical protein